MTKVDSKKKIDSKKKVSKKKQTKRIVKKIAKKVVKDVVLNNVRGINRGASIREGVLQNRMMNGIVPQNMNANPQMMNAIGKNEMIEKRNSEMATSIRAMEEKQKQLTEENKRLRALEKKAKQTAKGAKEADDRTKKEEDLIDKIKEDEFQIAKGTSQQKIDELGKKVAGLENTRENLKYQKLDLETKIKENVHHTALTKLENENSILQNQINAMIKVIQTGDFTEAKEILKGEMFQNLRLLEQKAMLEKSMEIERTNRKMQAQHEAMVDPKMKMMLASDLEDARDNLASALQTQAVREHELYEDKLRNIPLEETKKAASEAKRREIQLAFDKIYEQYKGTELQAKTKDIGENAKKTFRKIAATNAALEFNKLRTGERTKMMKTVRDVEKNKQYNQFIERVNNPNYDPTKDRTITKEFADQIVELRNDIAKLQEEEAENSNLET